MKVLLVNKYNYLKGGAERYFFDLADLLEKNGVTVGKFSMADKKNAPDRFDGFFVDNIEFNGRSFLYLVRNSLRFLGRIFYSFEAARKFERLIKEFKPDVVHLQNIYHQISPSIIDVAKKYKLPVVMHLHDYKLICPNYKLYTRGAVCKRCKGGKYYECTLNKCLKDSYAKSLLATMEMYFHHKVLKIYDKVDLFISPSRYLKDICVEFGIDGNKIKVLPNFVDPEKYEVTAGKNLGGDYLLFLGRLSDEKGLPDLIRSFEKIDNIKLKIVGSGPEEKKCREMIADKKLETKIEMLGAKSGSELSAIISDASALVVPSVWPENLPYVILEAFLFGKPVIASNMGGMPELIRNGENGFLFKAGDISDLAGKIRQFAVSDHNKLSENAKSSISEYFPKKYLDKIMDIYENVSKK